MPKGLAVIGDKVQDTGALQAKVLELAPSTNSANLTHQFTVHADYTKQVFQVRAVDRITSYANPLFFHYLPPPHDPNTYPPPQPSYAFTAQGSASPTAPFLELLTVIEDLSYDPGNPIYTGKLATEIPVQPSSSNDGSTIVVTSVDTGDTATFVAGPGPSHYAGTVSVANGSFTQNITIGDAIGAGPLGNSWTYGVHTQNYYGISPLISRRFYYTPTPRTITITGMRATPDGNHVDLTFDITTTGNSTLNEWSVELKQQDLVVRDFSASTDPRGPGVAQGTNPYNIKLRWDGRDSNNQPVVGNYTWVMTANTTQFSPGGNINDGIDSAQANLDGSAGRMQASIKQITSTGIKLLDVNNEEFSIPQYDFDSKKKDPIALAIRDAFPTVNTTLEVSLPPGEEPKSYFFWGENPAGELVFSAQHTPINGPNYVSFTFSTKKIEMFPTIKWYFAAKEGGQVESMGETDSPIYVTLDTPQPPQQMPRVDVVDFAVRSQKDNNSLNELQIGAYLNTRIYNSSGFLYDEDGEPHHTRTEDNAGRRMHLRVSDFLVFPGNTDLDNQGNCQDFSNLFHVCAAALGARTFEVRRIDGPFRFRRVWPVGFADWFPGDGYILNYHQTDWSSEVRSVFDPTYQLDNGGQPLLPINLPPDSYRRLLQDRSQKPDRWQEQTSVRILSVL